MWHEARKHEKKIRGIMIDHRRRAERRREFYESIRRDPASYLQIHGQQMKIHIDPVISQQAESSLVPWMGVQDNLIDRFDVRANLDYIPTSADVSIGTIGHDGDTMLTSDQECQLNYERFRNLVQNDFVDNNEQKVLHKIFLKERWGQQQQSNNPKSKNELKKKLAEKKAAIGYNYDNDDGDNSVKPNEESSSDSEDSDDEEEFEDLDTIVYIDQLDPDMCHRLNSVAKRYGIKSDSFIKFMQADKAEADRLRIAKEIENEKSMFVGRKSRRERKVLIQQRLLILRSINNDDCEVDHFGGEKSSMATKESISDPDSSSSDDDDSKSEVEEGKIEFITSFGNDEDEGKDQGKSFKKKMKKLERKRTKESSSTSKKKPNKIENIKKTMNTEPLMYGPTLPAVLSSTDTNSNKYSFNSTNNSQMKNRRYRFNKDSDDEDKIDHSPLRPTRRSPSVRRHQYSSDESRDSDDSLKARRRSRERRHRLSPLSRYRRSRSRSRSRSKSRHRSKRKSPSEVYGRRSHRSRSRERRHRHSSKDDRKRSKSRSRSRERYYRKSTREDRKRSKSPVDKSSKHKEKFPKESKSPDKKTIASKLVNMNEDNLKLYNLLEKIEAKTKIEKIEKVQSDTQPTKTETKSTDVESTVKLEKEKSPPVKRYYRHDLVRESADSESESSKSEDGEENQNGFKKDDVQFNNNHKSQSSTANLPISRTVSSASCITPQERLKRLMQAQLDKQYKLDKKAETDRLERQKIEQQERIDELTKLTRRRERSRRSRSQSSDSSRSSISYSSNSSNEKRRRRRHRHKRYSRSRSNSWSRSPSRSKRYYHKESSRSVSPAERRHSSTSKSKWLRHRDKRSSS